MKARLCAVYNPHLRQFCDFFDKSWLGQDIALLAARQGYNDHIEFAMDLAASMAFANVFLTLPNPAVGCLVIDASGKLLAASAHRKKGGFHAERRALKLAARLFGQNALKGSTVVCSLEPCSKVGATPACTQIISECGCAKVIYAASDATQSGANVLRQSGCLLRQLTHPASDALAGLFFAKDFALFKLAIRANADISGQISGAFLQRYTHEMRSKIPTLATFGNTVRTDLPRLDARFSLSKKPPNLLIFSHHLLYLQSQQAPLWSVAKRSISVRQFSASTLCGHILIEGGKAGLKLLSPHCDWLLLHFEASIDENQARQIALNPNKTFSFLPPLKPLALGRCKDGQYYAFFAFIKPNHRL